MKNRLGYIDILKGILIILVVVGHSDIGEGTRLAIYSFHMPLFFILNGFLYSHKKIGFRNFTIKRIKRLLVPYVCFFLLNYIIQLNFSPKHILRFIFGGRMIEGVYWFIPVLFMSQIALYFIVEHLGRKGMVITFVLLYSAAMVESYLPIKNVKIPLDADVVFLAVPYMLIGFILNDAIRKYIIEEEKKKSLLLVSISVLFSFVMMFLIYTERISYVFDMKYVSYAYPVLNLIIPLVMGIVILKLSVFMERIKLVSNAISLIGLASMTVMYLNISLLALLDKFIDIEIFNTTLVLLVSVVFYKVCTTNKALSLLFNGQKKL